ncbi:hypothetical protein ACFY36_50650 [Actinoplanes sp. NPDC000266]
MDQNLPFPNRRQRRDGQPRRRPGRDVLVGEKDIFDPASPADYREYRTVLGYGRR